MINLSLRFFFLSLLPALALSSIAFCSDLTGEVRDAQGNPVAGVEITVADSSGKVVGQATTNDAGRYCISGLDPGTYTNSATPPAGTGLKAGTATANVPTEGLTDNWSLAPGAVALSSGNPPGACGAAYFGGAGAAALGALAGGTVVGGTLGGLAAGGVFDDTEVVVVPASPSK